MEIFVLRHGHAKSHATTDSERPLSHHGRDEVQKNIEANLESLAGVEKIFVSPYLRAQQTCDVVMKVMEHRPRITTDLLVPDSLPDKLIEYLHAQHANEEFEAIMLVSHQPLVSGFIERLCGLSLGSCAMGTASLAAIETDIIASGCGTLRWINHID